MIEHSLAQAEQRVFWLDDLSDAAKVPRPRLAGEHVAQLVIVGGGYTGLWTAVLAKKRNPGARVVLVEAKTIGWAASGRNGGFCEASLTHGATNGMSRWPDEMPTLDRLGIENLDAIEAAEREFGMDFEFERNGTLGVAVEPHQVEWLHEEVEAAAARGDADVRLLDEAEVRAEVDSPTYLGGRVGHARERARAPGEAGRGARARRRGARRRDLRALARAPHRRRPARPARSRSSPTAAACDAQRAVLATNVFPSLLKRNRLMTVPVYDYVLMTEPLSPDQLAAIGWANRQGLGDLANQFHYYRLSRDNRILFGGYDAVYHYGRRVREQYEERPETLRNARRATSSRRSRSSRGCASATGGRARSTRARGSARSSARPATAASPTPRASRASGSPPPGSRPRSCSTSSSSATTSAPSLRMVRERPLPFPPEPAAAIGINADALVARPRRSLRREAQHAPEDPRRPRPGVRLMTGEARLHPAVIADAASVVLEHVPVRARAGRRRRADHRDTSCSTTTAVA